MVFPHVGEFSLAGTVAAPNPAGAQCVRHIWQTLWTRLDVRWSVLVFQVIRALEGSRKVCFADGAVPAQRCGGVQCWCVVGRHWWYKFEPFKLGSQVAGVYNLGLAFSSFAGEVRLDSFVGGGLRTEAETEEQNCDYLTWVSPSVHKMKPWHLKAFRIVWVFKRFKWVEASETKLYNGISPA